MFDLKVVPCAGGSPVAISPWRLRFPSTVRTYASVVVHATIRGLVNQSTKRLSAPVCET